MRQTQGCQKNYGRAKFVISSHADVVIDRYYFLSLNVRSRLAFVLAYTCRNTHLIFLSAAACFTNLMSRKTRSFVISRKKVLSTGLYMVMPTFYCWTQPCSISKRFVRRYAESGIAFAFLFSSRTIHSRQYLFQSVIVEYPKLYRCMEWNTQRSVAFPGYSYKFD